jgi:hypothetical protein
MDFDKIIEFIQANGYKDFITYAMLVIILLSTGIYVFNYIRKEIKKDEGKY